MVRKPYVKRCHECRRRKVKCGGEDPACFRCVEDRRQCPGYERALDIVFVGAPKPRVPRTKEANPKKTDSGSRSSSNNYNSKRYRPPIPTDSSTGSSSQSSPPNSGLLSSRRIVPQYINAYLQDDLEHDLPFEIIGHHLPLYGQPSIKELERIATISFLRDKWVPPVKLIQSFEEPAFTGSTYFDRWPLLALSEAEKPDAVMIRDALDAAGAVMMGGSAANLNAMIKGQIAYHRTLQALRKMSSALLRRISSRERDLCLLACSACSLYGMVMHMPFDLISSHIFGIEVLIKHCGINRLETQISRQVFLDMRSLNMTMSLLTGRALWPYIQPIEYPIWWDEWPPAQVAFQQLLNAASGIPHLIEQFSILQLNPVLDVPIALRILQESKEQLHHLKQWDIRFRDTPSHPRPESQIPALWLVEGKELKDQLFPSCYIFASFEGAVTRAFFSAIMIALLEHMIAVNTYLDKKQSIVRLHHQSLELAEVTCQSIEFFFFPSQRLVGRITSTFPFPMATRAFASALALAEKGEPGLDKDRIEKCQEWCDMVQRRLNDIFHNWSSNSWKDW